MRRLSLTALAVGLLLALAVAAAGPGAAGAQGARNAPLGASSNPDGTSGVPVNTVAPRLNRHGTVRVGARLMCSQGTWADDPTRFRTRWRRGRRLIGTGIVLRVRAPDARQRLACFVTAYNAQGAGAAASAGSVRVIR